MKKVIKLSREQLRGLIKEAIQTREPGSPLWEPLQEMPGRKMKVSKQETWALQGSIENAVLDFFEGMYDPSDPSMEAAGGQSAWQDQCMQAVDELVNDQDFMTMLDRVVRKLVDGEYHRGRDDHGPGRLR